MRRRLYIHERYRDDLQAAGIADLHALRAFAQCGAVTSQASTLVVRRHVLAGYGTYAKLYGHGTLNPRYFLRASRAWRELRSYQYLDRIGLRHPDVICVAEQRRCGCPIWSVIVTREVAPAPNLAELFCRSPGDDTQRADVIRSLAEAVARMHNAGFYYRTLRFRNILLHTAPSGAGELYFIDCPTGHAWTVSSVHDSLSDLTFLYRDFYALCRPDEWKLLTNLYATARNRDLSRYLPGIHERCRRRLGSRMRGGPAATASAPPNAIQPET